MYNDPNSSPSHGLARHHITFNINDPATLLLASSKMDSFKKEIIIQLISITSPLYPIHALKQLYSSQSGQSNDPLFSHVIGLFKSYFNSKIHELLLQADLSTTGYCRSLIHKGAAVAATAWGISKDDIKLMQRWKSDAVMVYLSETEASQLNSNSPHNHVFLKELSSLAIK